MSKRTDRIAKMEAQISEMLAAGKKPAQSVLDRLESFRSWTDQHYVQTIEFAAWTLTDEGKAANLHERMAKQSKIHATEWPI